MYLNEFKAGTNITISVSVQGHTIRLETDIIEPIEKFSGKYGYGIICNAIIIDDKIINFNGFPVTIDIFNKDVNRVYRYRASTTVIYPRKRLLIIYSHVQPQIVENRGAKRVPCIFKSILKFEAHTNTIDARTHDLSYTGGSFVIDKEKADFKVGDTFTVSIFDNEEHVYKTEGKIARIIEDFNPDLTFIGVRLKGDKIRGLISRLQMKETRIKKESF